MLLAQISDLHIVRPGQLVSTNVDTAAYLARAVPRLVALAPDAVVVTGDLVDHGAREEYEHVRELLAPLPMPVHFLVGNHDDRRAYQDVFGGEGEFVQGAVSYGDLRLITLDTLDPGRSGGTLCPARLDWLERELDSDASRAAAVILLAMHHPPFPSGIAFMDRSGFEAPPGRLEDIVRRHPKIERILCGHLHRPIVARFAGTVVQVVPSVAHQLVLQLAPDAPPAINTDPPAIGLHLWRPASTGLVSHTAYVAEAQRCGHD